MESEINTFISVESMKSEINNFINVWALIFVSVCYCFAVGKIIPKGTTRGITFVPVVCLFILLPFKLYSIHLGGPTIFFISWLGNFKLLLFALGKGPLSDPSLSLGHFVAFACLPIMIQKTPSTPNLHEPLKGAQNKEKLLLSTSKSGLKSLLNMATKALILISLVFLSNYREYTHQGVILFLASVYAYIGLDVMLSVVAIPARIMLGLELMPQFNDPYLSTSLQDFWGYRWNLAATDTLRLAVYIPVSRGSIPILGPKWSFVPAIFGTFLVSGLMHELWLYYHCRVWPTWGAMFFFLCHALFLVIEIALKRAFDCSWKLPQPISGPLVFGFVLITFTWHMMAQLLKFKVDLRAIEEYAVVGRFFKDLFIKNVF